MRRLTCICDHVEGAGCKDFAVPPLLHGPEKPVLVMYRRAHPSVYLPLDTCTFPKPSRPAQTVEDGQPTWRPRTMKQKMLNTLSHVWTAFRTLSMLNSVWDFMRDHFDDFL